MVVNLDVLLERWGWTILTLTDRKRGAPVTGRKAEDVGGSDQSVAVDAREPEMGVHFGVLGVDGEAATLGHDGTVHG